MQKAIRGACMLRLHPVCTQDELAYFPTRACCAVLNCVLRSSTRANTYARLWAVMETEEVKGANFLPVDGVPPPIDMPA